MTGVDVLFGLWLIQGAFLVLSICLGARQALRQKRSPCPSVDGPPSLTVLIPAYNEAATIRDCLRSVLDSSLRPERIIVVDVDWPRLKKENSNPFRRPIVMINPEVLEESEEDDVYIEGCLSLPGIEGNVWRARRIRYRYQDLSGRTHEKKAEDLLARCIMHEVDHLNGILFIDRMVPEDRRKVAGQLAKLRKAKKNVIQSAVSSSSSTH